MHAWVDVYHACMDVYQPHFTLQMGADLTKEMYNALTDAQKKALDIFYLQDCRTGKSYYYGSHAATSSTIKCRYCNPTWQDCDILVPKEAKDLCGKDGQKCESCSQRFKRQCRSHAEELRACPGCDADAEEAPGLRRCPPERDMNFAPAEELTKIDGIDDKLARVTRMTYACTHHLHILIYTF